MDFLQLNNNIKPKKLIKYRVQIFNIFKQRIGNNVVNIVAVKYPKQVKVIIYIFLNIGN